MTRRVRKTIIHRLFTRARVRVDVHSRRLPQLAACICTDISLGRTETKRCSRSVGQRNGVNCGAGQRVRSFETADDICIRPAEIVFKRLIDEAAKRYTFRAIFGATARSSG